MDLITEYGEARHSEELARLRRVLVLRGMLAEGMSQREVATALGLSQSAVSRQLKSGATLASGDPQALVAAAAPVLKQLAAERGFADLSVFGSVARGRACVDSDVDLLVKAPPGATIRDMTALRQAFEQVLGPLCRSGEPRRSARGAGRRHRAGSRCALMDVSTAKELLHIRDWLVRVRSIGALPGPR